MAIAMAVSSLFGFYFPQCYVFDSVSAVRRHRNNSPQLHARVPGQRGAKGEKLQARVYKESGCHVTTKHGMKLLT